MMCFGNWGIKLVSYQNQGFHHENEANLTQTTFESPNFPSANNYTRLMFMS